jgi:hypothetical protein
MGGTTYMTTFGHSGCDRLGQANGTRSTLLLLFDPPSPFSSFFAHGIQLRFFKSMLLIFCVSYRLRIG